MKPPIITLTTDFGTADPYVGMMKGAVLGINPRASIVDLCHSIGPQAIQQGAFIIGAAFSYFPADTIHVVVVDPGVGTDRKAILLLTPAGRFLAPDNGVLSYVLARYAAGDAANEALPPLCKAYVLDKSAYWRNPISTTFHGRDIFAPVAAHLSLGVPPEEMGTPVSSVTRLAIPRPAWDGDILEGYVVHIDRFGNLITDIPEGLLAGHRGLTVEVAGRVIKSLSASYAEGAGLLAIIGSLGYLEVSVTGGNAASTLGARIGDRISVRAVNTP